jgi:zinc D-Ala-D-Ala dipeptidase
MQKYFIYMCLFHGLISCELFYSSKIEEEVKQVELTDESIGSYLILEESHAPDTLELRLLELGLVDVQTINPNIWVDLKYSSTDNFMNTNVYGTLNRAYLQRKPAEMLDRAQQLLTAKDSNLHLLVYDAVRPVWVQWKMWNLLDTIPIQKRVAFVSNPKNKSVHNYGAAVDLTICNQFGVPLDMGAGFDDIREIAYPRLEAYYLNKGELSQSQIENRRLLREVMIQAGFRNIETEWWHFNAMSRDEAKKKYPFVP